MRANWPGRYNSFFKSFLLIIAIIKAGTDSKVKRKIWERLLRSSNAAACAQACKRMKIKRDGIITMDTPFSGRLAPKAEGAVAVVMGIRFEEGVKRIEAL
jgi:hypothetical protein